MTTFNSFCFLLKNLLQYGRYRDTVLRHALIGAGAKEAILVLT